MLLKKELLNRSEMTWHANIEYRLILSFIAVQKGGTGTRTHQQVTVVPNLWPILILSNMTDW